MIKETQKPQLNIPVVSGRFLLRILLSPFIFLWGIFMLAAGTLFPLPLLIMFSFIGFLIEPFIYLFRLSGSEINGIDPFIPTKYTMLSHLLGLTIYIWGAPAIVVNYVLTGEVWSGEETCH
jgi:hypothetical protein